MDTNESNEGAVSRDEVATNPTKALELQELQAVEQIFQANLKKLQNKLLELQDTAIAQAEANLPTISTDGDELATVTDGMTKL